jgi:competence protein ComEC
MSVETPTGTTATAKFDHPSVWLFFPTLSLLAGQGAATFPYAVPYPLFFLLPTPLLLVFTARTRRWALLIFVAAACFALGYVRHWRLLHPSFPENHVRLLVRENDERVYLEGSLVREPERLPNRHRWLVRCEIIWHPTGAQEISGNLLLSMRHARREWHYGDRVRFWIRLQAPRDSGNPGGFDYATYLARQEIYAVGYLDGDHEIELVKRKPSSVRAAIESLRREIRRYIDQHVPGDHGALMKALVVGDMGAVTKEMRNEFTAAGVNHVLSISGLHVSMLGLVVFLIVRLGCSYSTYLTLRCNLVKVATLFSFQAVVFYTAIAGAMVPTVRSAIMIGVYELAVLLDREEEVFASLTFAALLIALIWPAVIADISFQLSFLAVLFIVWGMRRMIERSAKRPRDELPQERSWWKEKLWQGRLHLAVPLFATLGTGPLIAHYFGHLSLAGFVANPIVVPLVGFVVVPLGLMTGFVSLILPAAAGILLWPAEYLLSSTLWLVGFFARLPLANIPVPVPNVFEVTTLYLLIVALFFVGRNRFAIFAVGVFGLVLGADAFYWWRERSDRTELRVTHLNVGQGDAAVVELPRSKVLVIDAGGTALGDFDTGESIVGPFLRSRKILKIDYLFLSHPRVDHYGGMRSIATEFAPAEFWSGAGKGKTSRFDDLEEALEGTRIKRVGLSDQEPCRAIDGVKLCVLYPPPRGAEDTSVVLRLEFGRVQFLFAGDIDKREELFLQQKAAALRSAILKVPRHGSASSSTLEFVTAVRPSLAIISAGARNLSASSRDEVAARYRKIGAEVLRTDEDGAIIIESDGVTIRYQGHKSGKKGVVSF